ncbi:MAG: RdgB/HAM1 family non-canonical purine NTP pyrophosphatase [Ruminococcus flavefaciens]|nr:RdgB/HAM1 family non-canonical purine NTP pyrophosphatase [Ruminococcus flavefaciens]
MIKKIVMATNNENKLREAREILSPLGIEVVSQKEAGVSIDPEENGITFADNALIKAQAIYDAVKFPVIADDSGLCVDALGGRPGVYSARYAPNEIKCTKLLDEMKNVPDNERGAYFECCIAFTDGKNTDFMTGRCYGTITHEERGTNGFGYDPVFEVDGKTLAEMSADEKNAVSHRGEALKQLYSYLEKRKGE